jgi:hypothetical protein
MHCVLQNITPMIFKIWNPPQESGARHMFKQNSSLEHIGSAMANSAAEIPSYLGHAPRRIDKNHGGFKAAEWKAWLLYYAVPLLNQHLDEKYVANIRKLSHIFTLATKWQMNKEDCQQVASLCIQFVKEYEELYYYGKESNLPNCRINIHYLLHLGQYIKDCGPACYWWQFVMERYCGIIKPLARSKSQLNVSLRNAIILREHLYNLRFVGYEINIRQIQQPIEFPLLLDEFQPSTEARERAFQQACRISSSQGDSNVCLTNDDIKLHTFKRCQLRKDLVIGSVESQRRGDVNRNDSHICFHTSECKALEYGEVQYFIAAAYVRGQWAFIKQFSRLVVDHNVGVVSYGGIGCSKFIKVEWIQSLIGIVREGGVNLIVSDVS